MAILISSRLAKAESPPLVLPTTWSIPQHLSQPQPLRLPSVKHRLDEVRRQAGEREQPAHIGVRDALLLRKVGDRLRLTALDLPPPSVRTDERFDQRLVAARLPCRRRHALRHHDQLSATPTLQAHRDAD